MTPLEAFEQGNFDEAVIALCANGVQPFSQDAKVLHAMAVLNKGDEEATKTILSTCSEDDPHVQKMLGYFAYNEDRYGEALSHYRRSLELDPNYAHAAHDLGVACSALGLHHEARKYLERACQIRPDWALARMDLGIVKLGAGDESGWIDYEARHEARGTKVNYEVPEWDGSDVSGKRFFLLAEQGFGDQIQFLRYAKNLSDMGARVLVGVSEKLRRFAALQAGVSEVYVMGKQVAPFDVWAYAMSMPRLMGGLRSMGGPSVRMGRRGKGNGLIGLNWKGNPEFKAEKFRRIPVPALAPILKDHRCVRLPFEMMNGEPGCEIPDFTSGCFDFLDTGMKMLDHLDALVTSCSGIAHLAGSIGIPTVLCLPENYDFRWKIEPPEFYYPTHVTVVNTSNWDETMERANSRLKDIL
ncbi:MAG: tetratricopeptide repeat protein [Candidatus Micrarchaeota archaeon]|nr:tetratricopeptide repeat protein [Candidatus Micrarchaeota archaeon]